MEDVKREVFNLINSVDEETLLFIYAFIISYCADNQPD